MTWDRGVSVALGWMGPTLWPDALLPRARLPRAWLPRARLPRARRVWRAESCPPRACVGAWPPAWRRPFKAVTEVERGHVVAPSRCDCVLRAEETRTDTQRDNPVDTGSRRPRRPAPPTPGPRLQPPGPGESEHLWKPPVRGDGDVGPQHRDGLPAAGPWLLRPPASPALPCPAWRRPTHARATRRDDAAAGQAITSPAWLQLRVCTSAVRTCPQEEGARRRGGATWGRP